MANPDGPKHHVLLHALGSLGRRTPVMRRAAPRRRPYWLVARAQNGRIDVLVAHLASGRTALPVFGFEGEAGLFLLLAAVERG